VAHLVCALLAAVFAAFTLAFGFGWSESSGALYEFTIVLITGVSLVLACAAASLILACVDLAHHFSPRGRVVWSSIMMCAFVFRPARCLVATPPPPRERRS
jgi:hypothetical protein